MTTTTDLCEKLENLAKWHDEMAYHDFMAGGVAAGKHHDESELIRQAISLLRREENTVSAEREECAKICEALPLDIDTRKWSELSDQYVIRVAEAGCRNAFAAAIRTRPK